MKTTRRRQTVAKKIKTAVVKNTFAAINVAQYGYEPTEIEVILEGYYFWFDEVEKQTSGQKSFLKTPADESGFTKEKGPEAIIHMTKKVFEKEFERLAALVFKAVNARDSGTIHDIANAIERLKRRTGASDIFRHWILGLKLLMEYIYKIGSPQLLENT